jgi:hypothetical protein
MTILVEVEVGHFNDGFQVGFRRDDDDGRRTLANTSGVEKRKRKKVHFISHPILSAKSLLLHSYLHPPKSFSSFFVFLRACVVWAPPALECGMHRRPLEASLSFSPVCVYVCVCVGCLHSVLYLAKARLPVFSRPVQPKSQKFLLFFFFQNTIFSSSSCTIWSPPPYPPGVI